MKAILPALAMVAVQCAAQAVDLNGRPVNPLEKSQGKPVVLIFVRTDCPISNRYAPEIEKLATRDNDKATFWLVYPDKATTGPQIRDYQQSYGYTVRGIRDPQRALVSLAHAEITPEAAVFDSSGKLLYHGRIDNWFEAFGRARPTPTTHELSDAIEAASAGKQPAVSSAPAVGCYISDLK